MTDANGRTGLDSAQAANHDKNADWNVVGEQLLGGHDCEWRENRQHLRPSWSVCV